MDDELMMELTHGWLFSAALFAYLLYAVSITLCISEKFRKSPEIFRKISGKFPAFYFSGKVTTLVAMSPFASVYAVVF